MASSLWIGLGVLASYLAAFAFVRLRPWLLRQLARPLSEVLRDMVQVLKQRVLALLRVGMLLFLDLEEEEQQQLRHQLNPALEERLFCRPMVELLPRWLQSLLGHRMAPVTSRSGVARRLDPAEKQTFAPEQSGEQAHVQAPGRGEEELELLLAGWTLGAYVKILGVAVRGAHYNARRWVRRKTPKLRSLLQAPSLLGAVAVSVCCGALGIIAGGCVGALCGLPCALFTFGLSVPLGAALGGSVGGCGGVATGLLVSLAFRFAGKASSQSPVAPENLGMHRAWLIR